MASGKTTPIPIYHTSDGFSATATFNGGRGTPRNGESIVDFTSSTRWWTEVTGVNGKRCQKFTAKLIKQLNESS